MKRFFLFSAIMAVFLIGTSAFSMDITPEDCRLAAENFLRHLHSPKQVVGARDLIDQEQVVGRVMELSEGGYLIVSATHFLPPIKAYSLTGRFTDLPPWYHDLLVEVLSQGRLTGPQPRAANRETYRPAWDYLLNFQEKPVPRYVVGTVLLTTRWGQSYPYNKKLPTLVEMGLKDPIARSLSPLTMGDSGIEPRFSNGADDRISPLGCSSIAGGENVQCIKCLISQYDKKRGIRSNTCSPFKIGYIEQRLPNGETIKSGPRFIHPENLVDELTVETPEYQKDEVAMLLRDMAMLFESNYGVDSTSGAINVYALSKYFGLTVDIRFMENYDNDLFFQTIKSEIDQERSVLFVLPGHGAVADGYVSDVTGNRVHLNMGWNGQEDDFYYVDEAIATDLITFPPSYQIIYNLKPSSATEMNGYDDVSKLEDGDAVQGNTLSAKFNTEFDIDRQDLYLKGPTTFTGAREGSLNQAFYIMVFKENGVVVETFDQPTTLDLPAGKYIVETCLRNRYGDGYLLDGDDRYTLTIDTQPLTDAEIKEIDEADIPPDIQNDLADIILTEPFKILIDAVDEDNHDISITARSSRSDIAVSADAGLLTLTPMLKKRTANKGWSRITVSASANEKDVEKSFVAFLPEDGVPTTLIDHNGELTGAFDSQTDMDTYKVFLDGEYRFQGFFGDPDHQWFFLSVLDSDGNIVVPPTDEFVRQTFEKGFYVIQASLSSDTSFYPFDPKAYNDYVIFADCISGCSDSSDNRRFIADLLDLDAPPAATGTEYRTEDPSSPLHGRLEASDPDGDGLMFIIVDPPGRGVLDLDAETGDFSYSPGFEVFGTDQFQFKVSDGLRESGAVTVTITVDPVPAAQNDSAVTKQKEPVAINVLVDNGNGPDSFGGDGPADSDLTLPDGANGLATPSHGEVALDNGGTPNDPDDDAIVYSPDPDYAGTDAFEYRICDVDGDCDAATVSVTVDPVPMAEDDSAVTNQGELLIIEVLADNNNGADSFGGDGPGGVIPPDAQNGLASPAHGVVRLDDGGTPNDPADDKLVYEPADGFWGTDSFTYRICDADGDCDEATVSVTVDATPEAKTDAVVVMANTNTTIDVLADNGAGADTFGGDGPSIAGLTLPGDVNGLTPASHGEATLDKNSTPDDPTDDKVIYAPNPDYAGTDAFEYRICDADGDCDTAMVTITVDAVPEARNDSVVTNRDEPVIIDVLADNGNGPDRFGGDGPGGLTPPIAQNNLTPPSHGTASLDDGGTPNDPVDDRLLYEPATGFSGTDSFAYRICDADGDCDDATVTVTVDETPEAKNDTVATLMNTNAIIDVLADNGNGPDSFGDDGPSVDALTLPGDANNLKQPAHGEVTHDDGGTPDETTDDRIVYEPAPGYTGTDAFEYKICDTDGDCDVATVTVAVGPVPTALDDEASTDAGKPVTISVLADNGNGLDTFGDDGPSASDLTPPDAANGLRQPSHGEVKMDDGGTPNEPADDRIVYEPDEGFDGVDSFEYRICDADGDCDTATVTVTVNHVVKAGDLNDSGGVDLADVVLCLQVLTGIAPAEGVSLDADVNGDERIGPEEAVFSLEASVGLR